MKRQKYAMKKSKITVTEVLIPAGKQVMSFKFIITLYVRIEMQCIYTVYFHVR